MKTSQVGKYILCVCIVTALPAAVFAEEFVLDEVTVTATKRAESLQDVPLSVTALSASEIEGLKLRDTIEIAAQIPNMQISAPFGDSMPVISLRGVAMDDFSLNQSSPVAVYFDEVYKGNPALQSVQMYDLERLEVLRGPQGTLYGKNSTGGAVNFVTKKPDFDRSGYLTVGVGDFSRKEVKAAYSAPLIDDVLAIRVAGTWADADGWNDNKFPGSADGNAIDEWGARATILFRPSDELQMTLRVSSSKAKPVNYAYTPIAVNDSIGGAGVFLYESFNTVTGVGPQSSFYTADVNQLDEFEVNEDRVPEREVENAAVSLTVTWDLSPQYTLTSISSYDDGEFNNFEGDSTPLAFFEGTYQSDVTQWAQDLRIASNLDGAFNFIAGVYWSNEVVKAPVNIAFFSDVDVDFDGAFTFNDCLESALYPGIEFFVGCSYRNDYEQERTTPAAYFDGQYSLTDALTMRFGVRYTEDEGKLKNYTADLYGTNGNVFLGNIISQASLVKDRIVDREWSGKVGMDYLLKNGALLYANYSRGYRSGAFNGQAFFDPSETAPVKPEILDAFELGFKSELMGKRIRLNGAVFYYDYSDQQFLQVGASGVQNLVNIDESSVLGAELETTALLTESLTIRAGLGWLDAEIDQGVLNQGLPEENDLKGNALIQAPDLNFNISLNYDTPLGDLGTLMFNVDANWVGDQFYDIADQSSGLYEESDYWLSNARVTFDAADDRYSIAAYVKNIADTQYFVQRIGLAAFGADMVGISGAPRTWGLEATYRF